MMDRNRIAPPADTTRKPGGSQKVRAGAPMTAVDRKSAFSEEVLRSCIVSGLSLSGSRSRWFCLAINQLRGGRSFEELLSWCLRSPEFAAKYRRFLEMYVGPQVASVPGQDAVPPRHVPLDAPAMQVECRASVTELTELIGRIGEAWTSMGSMRPYHSVSTSEKFLPENINEEAIEAFWASGSREAARVKSMMMKHGSR